MKTPKILYIDLETSPNLNAVFSLWQDGMNYNSLLEERSIISASWQWEGDPKMYSVSLLDCPTRLNKDVYDDYYVTKRIAEVVSEADVLIAHNGRRFDMKFLRTRALFNKLPPVPTPVIIDTLLECRKIFSFNCNRLDYIGKFLGLGEKIKTGQQLWNRIVWPKNKTDRDKAIREMVKYNKQDIVLLRKVYKRILPWVETHKFFYHVTADSDCPKCQATGKPLRHSPSWIETTKTYWYKRWRCTKCKGWSRGKKNIGRRE